MKVLLLFALVVLIHGSYATLLIKGPTQPVLEGDSVKLECLYVDSEANISQVRLEVLSTYMQEWRPIYRGFGCYRSYIEVTGPSIIITQPSRFLQGLYRCVSTAENVTAPDDASEPLSFKIHYMGELSMTREGYTSYLGIPQDLKVQLGDDVVLKCSAGSDEKPTYSWYKEGSDWILPSSKLVLSQVSPADEGQYTCMAHHSSVESLSKKRTFRLTVLPEDAPWYESSNGRLVLMTSAAAAALLVFILSVSVFLCRRAKQAQASRGPIDDRSQKKPIYKGSSESLPSACGDKQPLV